MIRLRQIQVNHADPVVHDPASHVGDNTTLFSTLSPQYPSQRLPHTNLPNTSLQHSSPTFSNNNLLNTLAKHSFQHVSSNAATKYEKPLTHFHQKYFTANTLYTKQLLYQTSFHQTAFTPNHFYTRTVLHEKLGTPNICYTNRLQRLTRRTFDTSLYTRYPLHPTAFTQETNDTTPSFYS